MPKMLHKVYKNDEYWKIESFCNWSMFQAIQSLNDDFLWLTVYCSSTGLFSFFDSDP